MAEITTCRLIQGPFHGDEGPMSSPPPDIFAVACENLGCTGACANSGVHWYLARDPESKVAERYCRAGKNNGVQLYIYADVFADPDFAAKDEIMEPMAA